MGSAPPPIRCFRCRRLARSRTPVGYRWCEGDLGFLCPKCGPRAPLRAGFSLTCPNGHGLLTRPGVFLVGAFAVFGAICLLLAGLSLSDGLRQSGWQHDPLLPIEELRPGTSVRVTGTIGPGLGPALSADARPDGDGGISWNWGTVHDFPLVQGNRTVWVVVDGLNGEVFGAPHTNDTNASYWPGDVATVAGIVRANGSGVALDAEAVSNRPDGFGGSAPLAGAGIFLTTAAGLVAFALWSTRRDFARFAARQRSANGPRLIAPSRANALP